MKMFKTYSLSALATIFSATQALTGKDLIKLNDGQTTGLIWNSDKSLCLKLSGNVFDDVINNSPANPDKKRVKKRDTCEGVSASFSEDCANLINAGTSENDLPLQYQFRIAEHADKEDRFCIISGCDDGLNESDAFYKLQWKTGKKSGKNAKFTLKAFGPDDDLDEYFQLDANNALTYGSYTDGKNKPVVWREKNGNIWHVKTANTVDRYDFFVSSCESDVPDVTDPELVVDSNNNPTNYTMCGELNENGLWDMHSDEYFEEHGFSNFRDQHLGNNEIIVNNFPATITTPGYPNNFITEADANTHKQLSCHAKVSAKNMPDGYVYRVKIEHIEMKDLIQYNYYGLQEETDDGDDINECSTNLLAIGNQLICSLQSNEGDSWFGGLNTYYYVNPADIEDNTLDLIAVIFADNYWGTNFSNYRFKVVIDLIAEADI